MVWPGFGRTRNAENKIDMARAFEPADDLLTAQRLLRAVLDAGADSIHVFPLGEHRMRTVQTFAACVRDVLVEAR